MALSKDQVDEFVFAEVERELDSWISRFTNERALLLQAAARIAELDALLVLLQTEKANTAAKRPPKLV